MFNKKPSPPAMDTIIGEYTSITGNIESEGSLKVLGKVEGDLKANGDIYIEPFALVTGNVYGSNVYLRGQIKGNVLAKGIFHLMAEARIYGDIEVGSIVTDEGAIFQGSCKMIEVEKVTENNSNGNNNRKNKLKQRKESSSGD